MATSTDTGANRPVATYQIGELTMEYVFRRNGIENVADMQAVFDAMEGALHATRIEAPRIVKDRRPPAQQLVMLHKLRNGEDFPFVGYWQGEAEVYLDALSRRQHHDVIGWSLLPGGAA